MTSPEKPASDFLISPIIHTAFALQGILNSEHPYAQYITEECKRTAEFVVFSTRNPSLAPAALPDTLSTKRRGRTAGSANPVKTLYGEWTAHNSSYEIKETVSQFLKLIEKIRSHSTYLFYLERARNDPHSP
jgi:hypothetical protein